MLGYALSANPTYDALCNPRGRKSAEMAQLFVAQGLTKWIKNVVRGIGFRRHADNQYKTLHLLARATNAADRDVVSCQA